MRCFDHPSRVRRRCLCALAVALGLVASGRVRADQDQQPVFRTSATMVTVDAVVVDKDGHHVVDLTPSDFEVLQRGKVQPLQHALYVPLMGAGHRSGTVRPAGGPGAAAPWVLRLPGLETPLPGEHRTSGNPPPGRAPCVEP